MIPRAELAAFRFGDGLPTPAEAGDPDAIMAALAAPDRMATLYPAPDLATASAFRARVAEAGAAYRADRSEAKKADFAAVVREGRIAALRSAAAAMARTLDTPLPFRERLVRFWADHFSVRSKSRQQMLFPSALVEDAIRPHLDGRFADLLRAVTLHPAMLEYLDQASSVGPGSVVGQRRKRGINENLARELMELHTLGVGAHYSQSDVTELAELLTGVTVSPDSAQVFRANMAEPGAETVLGQRYDGEGMAPILRALDDLAARPETALHLARKMAVHFVSDTPDQGLVDAMAAAFRASEGDLSAVYRAMLDHPAAWAPTLQKVRRPVDFVTAALRGMGVTGAAITGMPDAAFRRMILAPMASMGQPYQAPPGPNGWPEAAEAWITPQLLAARVNWAMTVPSALLDALPEPGALAARVLGAADDGSVAWAAVRAETRAEGVGLIFASPAFNRR